MITPPEATPSGGGAEGGVNTGALTHHSQVEGATGGGHHQPFQAQFIKSMIEDALDDFKDQVRQDVLNLHMEMIKQFQIHQVCNFVYISIIYNLRCNFSFGLIVHINNKSYMIILLVNN